MIAALRAGADGYLLLKDVEPGAGPGAGGGGAWTDDHRTAASHPGEGTAKWRLLSGEEGLN